MIIKAILLTFVLLIVLQFSCDNKQNELNQSKKNFESIALPWNSTFNCSEWTQSDGLYDFICDGFTGWGGWTVNGYEEQITTAANMTSGDGGRGQRHWIGDGTNAQSGGLRLPLPKLTEIWFRFYMRYQKGFKWNPLHYDKVLYFDSGSSDWVVFGFAGSQMYLVPAGKVYYSESNTGWQNIMVGSESDGLWHCYEIHMKKDSDGGDGEWHCWIDGVLVASENRVDYGGGTWEQVTIGSNQASPNNGQVMAVDFDDMVIKKTGYIGPIERK